MWMGWSHYFYQEKRVRKEYMTPTLQVELENKIEVSMFPKEWEELLQFIDAHFLSKDAVSEAIGEESLIKATQEQRMTLFSAGWQREIGRPNRDIKLRNKLRTDLRTTLGLETYRKA